MFLFFLKWCHFGNTVVYSFTKAGKMEQCVVFFDLKTGEVFKFKNNFYHEKKSNLKITKIKTSLKYMKNLLGVVGGGDSCALISQADDSTSSLGQSSAALAVSQSLAINSNRISHQTQYAIVLCNSIGTPIEYKYIDFQPLFWSMNSTHIVVASKSYFYLWNYHSMVDRN